jgi:hypothetical protein
VDLDRSSLSTAGTARSTAGTTGHGLAVVGQQRSPGEQTSAKLTIFGGTI